MIKRETKDLEYKEAISKSYLKTVSAFSNFNDGTIIFGITDDGNVVGIKNPNEECLNIENQINDSIKPKPDYTLRINEDNTITLKVYKGPATPYRYNGKCYKRNDSATVEVDSITENRLVLQGTNVSFEELLAKDQNCSFSILSQSLKETIGLEVFNEDTLKSLNLFSKNGYNNAASLLSDTNNFSGIDIVIFGSNINQIRKRFTLSGISLLKQYYESIKIFEDEYIIDKIEGGFRKRYELIPFEAFREVIANAIIHRTYDILSNTKVEMYMDKIVVSSPGGLTPEISFDAFINGRYSYLRNPIIGNVFHRLNIIEIFATGIKRINESYKDFEVKPSFDVTDSYISITLPIKKEIELTDNEKKVLQALDNKREYTRNELESLTRLKKDTLVRVLNSLISKSLVSKQGNTNNVVYRRTA